MNNILKDDEWQTIIKIILMINQSSDLNVLRKDFLTLIRLLVTFDKAEFCLDTDDFVSNKPVIINIEEEALDQYANHYMQTDSLTLFYQSPKSFVYRDTDVSSSLFLKNNEYYNGYLKELGTPFVSTINMTINHKFLGVVTLFRFETSGDFSDRDIFVLEQVIDHLANRLNQLKNIDLIIELSQDNLKFLNQMNVSKREIDVIQLLIGGSSNKTIGQKLYISELTVKKHITSIYNKLNVKNRIQLIRLFV